MHKWHKIQKIELMDRLNLHRNRNAGTNGDCHRCNREFSFDWHSDYRIWYKEENQITAGVFPDFSRESRLDDGIFGNPNSYYWYLIYTGSKNHKKTAYAFAGRLHHTGRVADGHRIYCDSGTALNGHHRTTGKKSTDVL